MAVKKATPAKKAAAPKKAVAVKRAAPKKVIAKKAPVKKTAKGDVYECQVCGLAVTIDETCGCVGVCDIICCKKSMKAKPTKAKAAKK
jgi:hypothetical protein